MFENLNKYRIERKSMVDIAKEKISSNITTNIVEILGLNDIYHLGCISMIHMLINNYDPKIPYNKDTLLEYLREYPKQIKCSDDVKNLVNECINELE